MTDDMQAELERLRADYRLSCETVFETGDALLIRECADAAMSLLERMWARIGELERGREWRPIDDDAMDGEAFIGGHFRDGLDEQRVVYFGADPAWPNHIWKLVDGDVTFHKDFFTHCKPLSKPPEQKP